MKSRVIAIILIAVLLLSSFAIHSFAESTAYTEWEWSDWTTERRSISDPDTMKEESRYRYGWWAAKCNNCGQHNPYWGKNVKCRKCGKTLPRANIKSVFAYTDNYSNRETIYGRANGRYIDGLAYWRNSTENDRTEYRYATRTEIGYTEWVWGDWTTERSSISDPNTMKEESRYRYGWWAAKCNNCGQHNPYWGTNTKCRNCGKTLPRANIKSVFAYTDDYSNRKEIYGRANGRYIDGLAYWRESTENDRTEYRYATRTANGTYTISYNANGGTGTPSSQTKIENVILKLSSITPTKKYVIQYNANGGSVTPASKSVNCTFKNWNSQKNGTGTSYTPGGNYTADADVTLYAQWTNPTAGELATPSRSGYGFVGWFTAASGGTQVKDSTTITGNLTIYAHWTDSSYDPYNLGDETYSFPNYSDSDSPDGHCWGMASTSSGYHLGLLDIRDIGGNASTPLYSFRDTATVRMPICYYQGSQGGAAINSTVAGGLFWKYDRVNIASDWSSVVNYVRNHNYDETGELLVTFWKVDSDGWSGHAVNFLRYENVNGQDRLYVYDNNDPEIETYFYQDNAGHVWETPYSTYEDVWIDSIGLHDVRKYYSKRNSFDPTHVLYSPVTGVSVMGYSSTPMVGEIDGEPYVMYEIPADKLQVIIVPNRDYADVIYMNTEYSFGEVTEGTYAVLKFATLNATGDEMQGADFQIFEGGHVFVRPDFTLPSSLKKVEKSAFEGITSKTVYISDTCTSIGAYAFRNSKIKQIRIPAGCSIADTAFDGCGEVEIFGTPGSAAEIFCETHDNCTFIAETIP